MNTWKDWTGQSRNKDKKFTRKNEPEWANCTAARFEQLLAEAEARKTTLEEMQGGWDYPAEEMSE